MKPTDAVRLTRLVKAVCPQQAFDEFTADAWTDLLADLRIDDCLSAVRNLGQRQVFIAPSEIRAEVRRIRNDRLERTPVPEPPEGWDYIEWQRHATKAIADDAFDPPPARGELKARDMSALRGTFRTIPPKAITAAPEEPAPMADNAAQNIPMPPTSLETLQCALCKARFMLTNAGIEAHREVFGHSPQDVGEAS